ncbi:hypothetical protein PHAVU_010G131100 [Phaseolus vulgaris]|uniref:ent-kaurenoic acid oxidase 1-like n=1 Tax=Phaseolus vulgaris TaxID=3885 RepID=UPI0035CB00E8
MWTAYFLQRHPEYFKKAKEEQEEIIRNRPPMRKGLSLAEVRKMEYLSKVVVETLRIITFSLMVFREAKSDVNINGYLIPNGWKVMAWFSILILRYIQIQRSLILRDGMRCARPENLIFGTRLCPGNDLAKLKSTYVYPGRKVPE